jgi:membrane protein DedA with SNARE-associated domain
MEPYLCLRGLGSGDNLKPLVFLTVVSPPSRFVISLNLYGAGMTPMPFPQVWMSTILSRSIWLCLLIIIFFSANVIKHGSKQKDTYQFLRSYTLAFCALTIYSGGLLKFGRDFQHRALHCAVTVSPVCQSGFGGT